MVQVLLWLVRRAIDIDVGLHVICDVVEPKPKPKPSHSDAGLWRQVRRATAITATWMSAFTSSTGSLSTPWSGSVPWDPLATPPWSSFFITSGELPWSGSVPWDSPAAQPYSSSFTTPGKSCNLESHPGAEPSSRQISALECLCLLGPSSAAVPWSKPFNACKA